MSRCRIVGADLTYPMLPYATDNARVEPRPGRHNPERRGR